jgi:hypothetical protein
MKDFAYRNAIQVDAAQDFDVHMARLTRAMDRLLEARAPVPSDFVRETPDAISLDGPAAEPEPEVSLSEPTASAPVAPATALQPPRRGVPTGVLIVAAALLAGGAAIGLDRFLAPPPAASGPEAADSRVKALQEAAATRRQADQDRSTPGADPAAQRQSSAANEPLKEQVKTLGDQLAAEKEAHRAAAAQVDQLTDETKVLREKLTTASAQPTNATSSPDAIQPGNAISSATNAVAAVGEESWTSEQRREVQRALALLGHYKGETDGGFGAGTRAAIKQFQAFDGDPETGMLTEPEHQALLQRAQRVAALLDQPTTSPEGVAADGVRGGAQRYAKGWSAETGNGAKQDVAEAAYWYSLAAIDGDARAFANLGTLVARGRTGTPPDPAAAAFLWQAAAARGDVVSMYNLGVLYERGIGVVADLARAKTWYQRAATHNHPEARAALKRLGA